MVKNDAAPGELGRFPWHQMRGHGKRLNGIKQAAGNIEGAAQELDRFHAMFQTYYPHDKRNS
jgi:hypothetical protein